MERWQESVDGFVETAKRAFGDNLISAVLYGSASEGKLRATSDVNLILVLKDYSLAQVNEIREDLRIAVAEIRLSVMYMLESELSAATEAFAVKFDDIRHRHRVLFGKNPFESIKIPRNAIVQRLEQVLLNLTLRLREKYALVSLREEQLAIVIADVTAPIRACAATILELEGSPASSPKEALQKLSSRFDGNWEEVLLHMSQAREERLLNPGDAESTWKGLMELVRHMYRHALNLK